ITPTLPALSLPCFSSAWGSLSGWQHLSPCAGAPTISIFQKPPGVIPPGGSTTIYCICQCSSGSFRMYKGGHQLPTLEQSGGKAEFSISNATYEDRGTYVCHYLEGDTELARSTGLEVFVEGEGCAVSPLVGSHAPGHTRMPVAISMGDKVFLLFPVAQKETLHQLKRPTSTSHRGRVAGGVTLGPRDTATPSHSLSPQLATLQRLKRCKDIKKERRRKAA
uniref:Ig-like domain-containing protein n=1 Tax=Zonotrichia albicollis TaxID=44394 RepID=A0A8D2MNI6_ZONAL